MKEAGKKCQNGQSWQQQKVDTLERDKREGGEGSSKMNMQGS